METLSQPHSQTRGYETTLCEDPLVLTVLAAFQERVFEVAGQAGVQPVGGASAVAAGTRGGQGLKLGAGHHTICMTEPL